MQSSNQIYSYVWYVYKQIHKEINQLVIDNHEQTWNKWGFTCCITVMSDGKILDHFPVSTFVGQREWSVTSLVDCTYIYIYRVYWVMQQLMCYKLNYIQCLRLGSQWCWFTRYLTVFKWPMAQARESGVSPALLTGSVEDHYQQRNSTDKHLLFGSTCLLMRALTISRSPREHSRERGVSPASFTATVDTSKLRQFAVHT